jgi:hypothetical protein
MRYTLTAAGKGVCDAGHASQGGVYDLPEGHCFWFQIYLTDAGTYVSGSADTAQWANDNEFAYNCNP